MALKLNKIDDSVIQRNLERDLEKLQKRLATPPQNKAASSEVEKYYEAIGTRSYDIGLMLYQQEKDPKEVCAYLARAGESFARMHTVREREEESERSPRDFERAVNLVICFCPAEYRRMLSKVQQWQYFVPHDPDDEPLVSYLEVLKSYSAGDGLDKQIIAQINRYCLSDTAPKEDRVFLAPKVKGLQAVAEKDSSTWERAISDLVKAHAVEAKRGEYRLLPEGFMSLPALMLAKLGEEIGKVCTIKSPYLPLNLLQVQK